MNLPIEGSLQNAGYLRVAKLQDIAILIIFKSTNSVLHGETAIWRCYDSKRFSEDIDLYVRKKSDIEKITDTMLLSGLHVTFNMERRGTVYYDISDGVADISLQIKIVRRKHILNFYEKVDGTKTQINTLTPETLILEKIAAYADRRRIRDVYDIMMLTKSVTNKNMVADEVKNFVSHIEKPKDESILKELIYEGMAPSFAEIVEYLRRWCTE